jgi:hypothetical protein
MTLTVRVVCLIEQNQQGNLFNGLAKTAIDGTADQRSRVTGCPASHLLTQTGGNVNRAFALFVTGEPPRFSGDYPQLWG